MMIIPTINFRGYRLSVDDVILGLKDIAEHSEYTSIFDAPFFALFRDIHDTNGTKVHMNIYYETVDRQFNLTMMPDRFREEWKKNADWLHLSFHARADKPDKPYLHASYDEVKRDCELVQHEILRFAGREVMPPTTTLHWGAVTREGVRALRDCGVKLMQSDFVLKDGEKASLCLYLDAEQVKLVRDNCFWKDEEMDMIFTACDVILNSGTRASIAPRMEEFQRLYPDRPFVDILIHEQYFYPTYKRYLSDYRERILEGVWWCEKHGYRPIFSTDMIGLSN